MPENIKWDGVLQSITDNWRPFIIVGIIVILGIIIFSIIKKRKKK